jgi:hypothetical protein
VEADGRRSALRMGPKALATLKDIPLTPSITNIQLLMIR